MNFYHGGKPGLRVGDLIVPGDKNFLDDCPICQAKKAGLPTIDPPTKHPDRVYVTSDREYARYYASLYPRGDLYSVEPIGEIEPSSEDHFATWTAQAARVRSVYARYVLLTWTQRRSLLRRWVIADREAAKRAP